MTNLNSLFTKIAQEHLNIETLEERFSDSLDFHDVGVVGIQRALAAAYEAGKSSTSKPKPAVVTVRFARKPVDLEEIKAVSRYHDNQATTCQICETREMEPGEYDAFARNPMQRREWLAGKGGYKNGYLQAIELKAPGRATLYVNPEGSDYGRYVGMAEPEKAPALGFQFPTCN